MPAEDYSAFRELKSKTEGKVHRIRSTGRVEGEGSDAVLVLTLPVRELALARRGTGQRRSLGFALGPVDFVLPDGSAYQLYAAWVSLTSR